MLVFCYLIFLWDNDRGETVLDDELQIVVGLEEYLLQSLSYNLNNFNDTLISDAILPPLEQLLQYDALFVVNGTNGTPMDSGDLVKIDSFICSGKSIYIEGENIAEFLSWAYPQILDSFHVEFDGNTYLPFQSIIGTDSSFASGENFLYFQDPSLFSSCDILQPFPPSVSILVSPISTKAYVCRTAGYSYTAEKKSKSINFARIISTINFTALKSLEQGGSIDTRNEFMKKILSYMGFGRTLVVDYADTEENKILGDLEAIGRKKYDVINYSPEYEIMKKYSSIIWRGGKNGIPLSDNDTINIKKYINYGGRILLTGENIAENLGITGQGDVSFLTDYFGVDYIAPSVSTDSIEGAGTYTGFLSPYQGLNPDWLQGANICFIYTGTKAGECAGVSNNIGRSKTLFLGFSYDELKDNNQRRGILNETYEIWNVSVDAPTGIKEREEGKKKFLIITREDELRSFLPLFDLSGRKIENIERGGIYFYRKEGDLKIIIFIK